ncbi:NADPH-dependent FMN reductase [uncultured Thiothrix sp.]|uniref:NADPH-dependent FMN reductase n=1 Tax=uncultured Thiothrix sp. TaxID=223185 RepID=UPI002624ADAF|nr:NAD(P)H-dependent oxidoreductase [uncultured Thiothrix sp.]
MSGFSFLATFLLKCLAESDQGVVMQITIISGSHRHNSQSEKVAKHVQTVLTAQGIQAEIFSLAGNPLPLWDESIWDKTSQWSQVLAPLSAQLAASDAFVIITPEWHGQVTSGLKNFFLLWGKNELAHKPALIIAVSSSTGGVYPVAELRMSSYKNNRICYLPEHIIIRQVTNVLNEDATTNDSETDAYYRKRIHWALGILERYAQALAPVRAADGLFNEEFRNGM